MIKDLFRILVTVSVNVINHVIPESICTMTKLVDKSVKECTENIDEVKIGGRALFEHENECVCSYTNCAVFGCNNLNNQHWNWCLFCLFSLVLTKGCYLC